MCAAGQRGQRSRSTSGPGRRSSRCRTFPASCRCRRRSAPDRAAPDGERPGPGTPGGAAYPEHLRAQVERYLESLRFAAEPASEGLEQAMRYSLLAGGKRIRPVLALATASAIGRDARVGASAGGLDRADPHLFADPRRPAGDGRRRPAPRPADLPRAHSARTSRSWPGTGSTPRRSCCCSRGRRRSRRGCSPPPASSRTRPGPRGWSRASTSTSPGRRRPARPGCAGCTS